MSLRRFARPWVSITPPILDGFFSILLEALPSQSRVYLNRTTAGIEPIIGLTALQAKSLMTQGFVKALHILVEDACAKAVLSELIRRIDVQFHRSVGIFSVGNADTVARTVRALHTTNLPVAAVLDGDKSGRPSENIFKLPGTQPPEKEIFQNPTVRVYVKSTYDVNLEDFLVSTAGVDHHDWLPRLAEFLNQDGSALVSELARVYVSGLSEPQSSGLVNTLKEAVRR
jgi:hypothetical protein